MQYQSYLLVCTFQNSLVDIIWKTFLKNAPEMDFFVACHKTENHNISTLFLFIRDAKEMCSSHTKLIECHLLVMKHHHEYYRYRTTLNYKICILIFIWDKIWEEITLKACNIHSIFLRCGEIFNINMTVQNRDGSSYINSVTNMSTIVFWLF